MTKFRRFIRDISNLRDALRVLEIMDHLGGVDIERYGDSEKYWRIKPKSTLTERDARDLQAITLYKCHYKNPPKWFHKLFYRNYRYGSRDFYWCGEEYFEEIES